MLVLILFKGLPTLFQPSALQQVKSSGELIVVTRNSPTTYYEGPDGPVGLEYELASMFAEELGVRLKIVVPDKFSDIFNSIKDGDAHIAAAGLTITEKRKNFVRFGPAYQEITQQLIYNSYNDRPRSIDDVSDGILEVVAASSHVEHLKSLKEEHSELTWKEQDELDSEELLKLVADEVIDYTIADSNEVSLNRRFLLNIRVAFDLTEPQQLAWAFPISNDSSLYDKAMSFFWRIESNGELTRVIEKFYGHVEKFDYVGTVIFLRHIATRLPKYYEFFTEYASLHNIDWRLLSAMGYQESHWNPSAVSPTGVRGIMMLTMETAAQMGIKNRMDPKSSISGGARYLALIKNRIPEEVKEPDRSWMALAAYNVGYYHLVDARKIAVQLKLDPNLWINIEKTLPLLARKKWYKKTRYGYARGWEPVRYVENIRSYYDILKWQDLENSKNDEKESDALSIMPDVL